MSDQEIRDKQQLLLETAKVLKSREILFLRAWLKYGNNRDAYKAISPDAKDSTADANGSRMMRRIRAKLDVEQYFDECNLGLPRFARDLNRQLKAKKTIYYKGVKVADAIDNAARGQALTLLADVLKLRKQNETNNKFEVVFLKADEIKKPENTGLTTELKNVTGTGTVDTESI